MKAIKEYINEVYGEYGDIMGGYVNATKENKNMDYVVIHPNGEIEFYTEDKLVEEIKQLKEIANNKESKQTLNMYEQIIKMPTGVWTNVTDKISNKGDLEFTIAFKYK